MEQAVPKPNRLIHEASPYLRQHAYNPVDWYPWGEEALAKARAENRPIFLSIGYSTCHWCHVMAHECFENPEIAALMNQYFVNIKVDREERPDLDEIYMQAVQLLTGRGGWPLSVFLTPDLRPFYGGTYFPPEDRGGLPGFPRLLKALAEAYQSKQANIANVAALLEENLQLLGRTPTGGGKVSLQTCDQVAAQLAANFDPVHGGHRGAPKFPPHGDLAFWHRYYYRTRKPEIWQQSSLTLQQMASGGIYDQLRGGFHRYAVDERWLIPHFEKMLYDNAQLAQRYLEAYQLSGDPFYASLAQEILDYVLAEMTAPEGGFYAAQDADSEGVEGKFFVWTPAEITAVVGEAAAPLVLAAFGVTTAGNFEHGTSVLSRPRSVAALAEQFGMTPAQVTAALATARRQLLQAREQRVRPHRDDKIITAWNGLMISALAQGAQVLGRREYLEAAKAAAHRVLLPWQQEGRLRRLANPEARPTPGFLDDYAYLMVALLDLFETDLAPRWLELALELATAVEDLFLDPADGGYFSTPRGHETLLVRPKNFLDLAVPSGNSMVALAYTRLSRYTEKPWLAERVQELLTRLQEALATNGREFAYLAAVQEIFLAPPLHIVLTGEETELPPLLAAVYRQFLPHRSLVVKTSANAGALDHLIPWAAVYASQGGRPTAFVCPGQTCLAPVHEPEQLTALLTSLQPT